jgi:hypothetical protein
LSAAVAAALAPAFELRLSSWDSTAGRLRPATFASITGKMRRKGAGLEGAMFRWAIVFLLSATSWGAVGALEIKPVVDNAEKVAYLNMWGKIEPEDGVKFREIATGLARQGLLIYRVNIFSNGGSVAAAKSIGDQIRTLNAITQAPFRFYDRRNGQWVQRRQTSCWLDQKFGDAVMSQPGEKLQPCDCASACFLIWASGISRMGNHVGVHRFYFDREYFGSLPVTEAQTQYARAEDDFRGYLSKLNVPTTIVDRLFATDSKSMYYLSKSEIELMASTPSLEEYAEAKCGPDKTQRQIGANSWTTKFDNERRMCNRRILKELMQQGVNTYLK